MKKFNETEKCPKCGYKKCDIKYIPKDTYYNVGDILKIACKRCGFFWDRIPLDGEVKE